MTVPSSTEDSKNNKVVIKIFIEHYIIKKLRYI